MWWVIGFCVFQLGFAFTTAGVTSRSTPTTTEFTTVAYFSDRTPTTTTEEAVFRVERAGWLVSTPLLIILIVGTVLMCYIKKRRLQMLRQRNRTTTTTAARPNTVSTVSYTSGADEFSPPSYEMATRGQQVDQLPSQAPPSYDEVIKSSTIHVAPNTPPQQ